MSDRPLEVTDARVEEYLRTIAMLGRPKALPERFGTSLALMEAEAIRRNLPICGPLIGRLLYLFGGLVGARRIFDAGCGFGYSSAWLAAGAGKGATITCVDYSEELVRTARQFHQDAGLKAAFDYRFGDAVATLEQEAGPYDLILNDVDKHHFPRVARLALDRLRRGGIYIADNALWHGKVVSSTTTRDAWTAAVDRHNQELLSRSDCFVTLIDQRDGLLVAVKQG